MADRLRERETDLQQYRKQGEDLTKQLDHPFEHEEKLATATARQQEIVTALDLTKNQAAASVEGTEEGEPVAETQDRWSQKRSVKAGVSAG